MSYGQFVVYSKSGGVVNRLYRVAAAGVAALAVTAGSVGVAAAADTGFYLESVKSSGTWVKPGGKTLAIDAIDVWGAEGGLSPWKPGNTVTYRLKAKVYRCDTGKVKSVSVAPKQVRTSPNNARQISKRVSFTIPKAARAKANRAVQWKLEISTRLYDYRSNEQSPRTFVIDGMVGMAGSCDTGSAGGGR